MSREPNTAGIYNNIDKIDAHMHLSQSRTALQEEAALERFSLVSINTEVSFFPTPDEQRDIIMECRQKEPGTLNFIATFGTGRWGSSDWQEEAIEQIRNGLDQGAVAVKIWKNIGMELRDRNGNLVMIDHPSFDPVLDYLETNGIPLLAHLGEPRNCWLPLDEMTVTSDQDYFSANPQYHMHLHSDYPSYEEQLEARDHMLARHPDLRFVGAHMASIEWNVEELARWLDAHPYAGVDLAERVCHLQHQAVSGHDKVREFVETYHNRIIYGSDQIDDGTADPDEIRRQITTKWRDEFAFFAGSGTMTAWNVDGEFRGLGLSEKILVRIFRENALHYYPLLTQSNPCPPV